MIAPCPRNRKVDEVLAKLGEDFGHEDGGGASEEDGAAVAAAGTEGDDAQEASDSADASADEAFDETAAEATEDPANPCTETQVVSTEAQIQSAATSSAVACARWSTCASSASCTPT